MTRPSDFPMSDAELREQIAEFHRHVRTWSRYLTGNFATDKYTQERVEYYATCRSGLHDEARRRGLTSALPGMVPVEGNQAAWDAEIEALLSVRAEAA